MAGGNKTRRSDYMELPKDSDDEDECECHVFRQVEAVTSLHYVFACHHLPQFINTISICPNSNTA
ncbi:MAG: hypothetical protein LBC02_06060 [Planctomycetaceae bacterium]|nr:hypothetical protein [Planctomycetaceae bacterium]